MEVKRRDFIKISGLALGAAIMSGFFWTTMKTRDALRKFIYADKTKKYPGKLRPMGDEIRTEGKWNG